MKTYAITLFVEVDAPNEQVATRVASHLKADAPLSIFKEKDARGFKILGATVQEKKGSIGTDPEAIADTDGDHIEMTEAERKR